MDSPCDVLRMTRETRAEAASAPNPPDARRRFTREVRYVEILEVCEKRACNDESATNARAERSAHTELHAKQ